MCLYASPVLSVPFYCCWHYAKTVAITCVSLFFFNSSHFVLCIVFLLILVTLPAKCMVLCGVLFFKCYFFSSSSIVRCHCIVFGILILTWVNMALHFQAPPNERETRELKKMANKFLSNVNLYRYWYMFEMPHHIVRIKWNSFYCYCFMFCMLMILNILSVSLSLVSFLVNLLFDLRLMSLLASFYFDEKSHAAQYIDMLCIQTSLKSHTKNIFKSKMSMDFQFPLITSLLTIYFFQSPNLFLAAAKKSSWNPESISIKRVAVQ